MKKVGKTNRPFRSKSNDLNQIPYDYTVEVRNRFKGLDLIDRVLDELWTEVRDIVQETGRQIMWGFVGQCKDFREGNVTPLQYSCLENPMDGEAW